MTIDIDSVYLDHGSHNDGHPGGCLMEWTAIFAGLTKTDHPPCTNTILTSAAIRCNDSMSDVDRQRLKVFIPRLARAKRTSLDRRVNVRLAIWSARYVLHLVPEAGRSAADAAIAAAEGWLAGTVTEEECAAAAAAVDITNEAAAAAASTATAAAAAASAAASTYAATGTAAAGADADADAAGADADARIRFLDGLLDAHEKAMAEEGVLWEDEFCAFAEES